MRRSLTATVIAAVIGLTSAGGGSGGQAAAPAPVAAAEESPAAGAGTDVCALVPATTAARISGLPVTEATPDVTSGEGEHQCLYSDAQGGSPLTLWVNATTGTQAYAADLAQQKDTAKPITGLGDQAFMSVVGLEALFGSTLVKVAGVDDVAAATALAEELAGRL